MNETQSEFLQKHNATVSSFHCPTCNNPLFSQPLDGGIRIWCPRDTSICPAKEIIGFGKNEKTAFEILIQKTSRK